MVKLLLIDNYDSFTFNLAQAFEVLGAEVVVVRNDQISLSDAESLTCTHLCISPGPGRPADAGMSMSLIEHFQAKIPILGVCLGHQCIAEVFGGRVVHAKRLMHGKDSKVRHDGEGLYRGLPNPFVAGRYHSLAVPLDGIPESFVVDAQTDDGEVMGMHHKTEPI
ncbi:MAG: aminodeoxychorismate/anthranilate synthase component II, partial [Verrucomicrobiota bacterium]|nr:aminodeoxychorismate/anthranilate synthase component II [Verrucomicrobiota bacterium]